MAARRLVGLGTPTKSFGPGSAVQTRRALGPTIRSSWESAVLEAIRFLGVVFRGWGAVEPTSLSLGC